MKKYFHTIALCITVLSFYSQEDAPSVYFGATSNAPSPTAAGLGKYGDVPVSLYTGVPNINIPFYSVTEGNLSIPISLSYHSQGFKVEEMASWVGLGWSLNAGGVITRAVKGVPDDFNGDAWGTDIMNGTYGSNFGNPSTGFLSNGPTVQNWRNSTPFPNNSELFSLSGNQLDGQPDIFYFNFPGASGQFMFDNSGVPRILSQTNFKISYTRNGSGDINKFEIVDGNGNIYTFDQVETTKTLDFNYAEDMTIFFGNGNISLDDNTLKEILYGGYSLGKNNPIEKSSYNSSWYLSKVKNATGDHEINFSYTGEQQIVDAGFSFKFQYTPNPGNTSGYYKTKPSYATSITNVKRLSQITWQDGKIIFEANHTRTDANDYTNFSYYSEMTNGLVNYTPQSNALTGIVIKDNVDNILKRYNLNYDYFLAIGYSNAGDKTSLYKRLKLLSVTEQNNSATLMNPPHLFEYDESVSFVPRFSQQQDWWGFMKSNTAVSAPLIYFYPNDPIDNDFLSEFSVYPRTNHNGQVILGSYDRNCDVNAVKTGLLKKITYPTKGSTSFLYESHQFYLMGQNRNGGGVRIKKIVDFDGVDDTKNIIKNFEYQQTANTNITSGKVLTMPVFANRRQCYSNFAVDIFNNSMSPLGTTMGSLVGYGEVTTEYNGNGKIISKFNQQASVGIEVEDCSNNDCVYYRTHSGQIYYSWPWSNTWCYSKTYFPFPDNPNYDWIRGSLLEEKIYDNQNRILKKTVNEYTIKNYQKIYAFTCKIQSQNVWVGESIDYDFLFGYASHYFLSGWQVLSKQTITDYDVANAASTFTQSKNFYYDNPVHKQITKITNVDSKGIIHENIIKRCLDFNTNTGFLSTLNSQNRLNEIIEKQSWLNSQNNRTLLGATFTEYKDFSVQNGNANSQLLPYKNYSFETVIPVPESNLVVTNFNGANFTIDSRFKANTESNFDSKDNLTRISIYNGGLKNSSSKIYGHNKGLLIANVSNATEADCGFTSFESDDYLVFGNYASIIQNDGHCGTKSYSIAPNNYGPGRDYMPSSDAQNKKFIFSCWVKTNSNVAGAIGSLVLYSNQFIGSGAIYPNISGAYVSNTIFNTNNVWKYIEVEIDLKQIKLNGGLPLSTNLGIRSFVWNTGTAVNIQVDDMRFYPKEARMSSYTYIPQIGVSSISDENSNCQYYEYDTFGRLKLVKDQNGKILEKTDYNYKP